MRLIDADELIEHAWRDKLDSRELIAEMIEKAPTIKEIPTKIPIGVYEELISQKVILDKVKAEIDKQDKVWKTKLDKIKAEIDAQDLWLSEAGYSEYNMNIALNSIKHAMEESEET